MKQNVLSDIRNIVLKYISLFEDIVIYLQPSSIIWRHLQLKDIFIWSKDTFNPKIRRYSQTFLDIFYSIKVFLIAINILISAVNDSQVCCRDNQK